MYTHRKEDGLGIADFVSIHLPLNKDTKNFISQTELKLMKKNSVLVNTSRGGIVNENDLYQALKSKKIRGAGIDVFISEPPESNHPFFQLNNIFDKLRFAIKKTFSIKYDFQ